jgi:hypothetical protein
MDKSKEVTSTFGMNDMKNANTLCAKTQRLLVLNQTDVHVVTCVLKVLKGLHVTRHN